MRKRVTPFGALARGLVAGAVGSFAQNLFFRATARMTPQSPEGVFEPPEPQQESETATQTVARRFTEHLLGRTMPPQRKEAAGLAVHVAFGSIWGGLYGLARESLPIRSPLAPSGIATMAGFSTLVWGVGDNFILPAFRLAAWPHKYPAKVHAYAWAAHLWYGLAVALSYEAMRPPAIALAAGTLSALALKRRIGRSLPSVARPALDAALDTVMALKRRDLVARGRAALDELRS